MSRSEATAPPERGTGALGAPSPGRTGRRTWISGRGVVVALVVVALACVPLSYPVLDNYAYVVTVMTSGLMWIALASSWNLLGGFTGYISLGHNVFLAVGAYLAGYLLVTYGISPFVSAILCGLACVVAGAVVGLITLRTRGDAFIIATIALMLAAQIGFNNLEVTGGAEGLSLPPLTLANPDLLEVPFYYAMLVVAVLAVAFAGWVAHSKLGLGLRAIAQDETKAEVAGINTRLYKIVAYAFSSFFIGVAGAIWGYSLSYLNPNIFLTISLAADMMLMSVIGGRGTVAGPVLGAVLITVFNEVSVTELGASDWNLALTGILLVGVLLLFPAGIVGSLRARRRLPRLLDWD